MTDEQHAATTNQTESEKTKATTTVTCPHCGKDHEVTVEVPEQDGTPKLIWED